ncbi:MAG: flagellar basal body protein, partial [Agathobaculum sp.]|uniref:FlgK family flagellar hook-associated protein n=2 Tax=Agathobaculum sp. TaxID=2048138 RepID=UPI002A811F3F
MATFGEFTVARLGMIASQMALNVTGQNISNINTAGYTRQRLDQYSFITNGSGLYHSNNSASVGSGVMLAGVSQLRDPYLDIRFRKEMSSVGSTEATLGGLEQVLSVINDVNKTGITTQIQDLFDRISRLNTEHVGEQEFDTLVRASANSLCQLLNQTATDLQTAFDNERSIYEQNVQKVDGILEKIQELNEQIRRSDINGDSALELRDQRNTLIDELSSYVKIDVTYDKENLGAGFSVEQLNIKLVNNETNRPDQTLIQGIYRASISFDETDPALLLNISELTDSDGNLASNTASKFVLSDLSFGAAAQGGAATIKLSYTEKDGTAKTKDIQFTITAPTITQGMTMEQKLAAITQAKQATLTSLQTAIGQDQDIDALFTVSASSTGVTLVSKEKGADAAAVTKMELQGNATDVIFERAKATAAVKSNAGTITEGMGYGSLESTRRMLTGAGEFRTDGGDTSIRGIPYFVNSLDMIANKFATEMNRVNTTKPDGTAFADTGMDAHKLAGNLFTAKGDDPKNPTQRITASNISISTMWKNGETQIVASVDGKADQSSMNDNITR